MKHGDCAARNPAPTADQWPSMRAVGCSRDPPEDQSRHPHAHQLAEGFELDDAEFRYDREPVGALQGGAPERVATCGTVSKSLAPGLRLGWVACPPGLAETVADEKRRDDHGSPTLV
jgi:hypothetical protein